MAGIDFDAVRARHRLGPVARRTGLDVPDTGRAMVCCPLPAHDDRHPSMRLDLDRHRYHCFGCGAHGDVIQWVCDVENVRPGQAVAILDDGRPINGIHSGGAAARRYLSRTDLDTPDLERTPPERVRVAMQTAWRYYTFTSLHRLAIRCLVDQRHIDIAALELEAGRPVVGHTPSQPDRLVQWLRAQHFTDDELVDAGLATRRRDGTVIDFFRDRLLLPVTDERGEVIGIIGRTTTGREPRYLNQTLTRTYDKHLVLYQPAPHHLDGDANVVVVEGTLDALAIAAQAARAGLSVKYAPVSASGVHLSDQQLDAILDLHPRAPVLAADGDDAGRDANLEWAARIALRYRETVITTWPEGEDPASWLAARGPDGLTAVTRRGCLDIPTDQLRPQHCGAVLTRAALSELPDSPAERAAGLHQLAIEVGNISRYLGHNASDRYATKAAELLAPVAVNVGIAAATGRGMSTVIEHVATYGSRLPPAGRTVFTRRAAEAIVGSDLIAAERVQRRLWTAVERRAGIHQPASLDSPAVAVSNTATACDIGGGR